MCRFETCTNVLGYPFRYVRSGRREITFLCPSHRSVVSSVLMDPDPDKQVVITDELWVYLAVPSLSGMPMEKE